MTVVNLDPVLYGVYLLIFLALVTGVSVIPSLIDILVGFNKTKYQSKGM